MSYRISSVISRIFRSKTNHLGLFRKSKTHIIAKIQSTDFVAFSNSGGGGGINTV